MKNYFLPFFFTTVSALQKQYLSSSSSTTAQRFLIKEKLLNTGPQKGNNLSKYLASILIFSNPVAKHYLQTVTNTQGSRCAMDKHDLPINSVTGSCSPSVLIVPAILSFSKIGRKSCTKSEVYGGAITSSTWNGRQNWIILPFRCTVEILLNSQPFVVHTSNWLYILVGFYLNTTRSQSSVWLGPVLVNTDITYIARKPIS